MPKLQKWSAVSRKSVAEFCGVDDRTITNWLHEGCPRNPDGKTYDLRAVHAWLLARAGSGGAGGLKEKKLEQEIEKLKITNSRLAEKYIDREEHERILTGRAVSLRNYLERCYQLTRGDRSMRSVEELAAIDARYAVDMMAAYCGGDGRA